MTIKMDGLTELPEIKSELNSDDFHSTPATTTAQHQPHLDSTNNCQWVSFEIKPEIPICYDPLKRVKAYCENVLIFECGTRQECQAAFLCPHKSQT